MTELLLNTPDPIILLNKRQATEKAPRLADSTGISSTMAESSAVAWSSRSKSAWSSPGTQSVPGAATGTASLARGRCSSMIGVLREG